MSSTSVDGEVRRIVCEQLGVADAIVTEADEIRELPGVESIKILRAITRIEARFGIELEDEVVFQVQTFRELVELIERKLGEGDEPAYVCERRAEAG